MTKRTVLIDTDIIRYSHGAISMRHPFLEGEFVPASAEHICGLVDDLINKTIKATGADDYLCILSGKENFRTEIAKQAPYKGNRDPKISRPHHFKTVEEHIKDNHPFVETDGFEADDWMGLTQYEDWKEKFRKDGFGLDPESLEFIIASRDKDLRTVQGWHYSWSCGEGQPEKPLYYITPYQGMRMFFYQMLIGDNTDNIIGCGVKQEVKWGFQKDEEGNFLLDEKGNKLPKMMLRRKGIGGKTADKILGGCKTVSQMKDAVLAEYEALFKDDYEEIALENARLLFIGQTDNNLFEWQWIDQYLELTAPEQSQEEQELTPEEAPNV